ncbi:hypothetical protein LWI28_012045 [Acer negundo]|uniref:PGG domain-containing protein n=1 Tax=Acer negundo TaxID=4023 RepID=A0AAD5P2W3_ACENE|nr:hypothetical protein LWI28_012045 [Acer negundo]
MLANSTMIPTNSMLGQKDTIVVSLAAADRQIDSHDPVLPAESSSIDADHSTTQSPQNQNHVPTYQLNSPDRSLLPNESNNRDQYRLKCVPLQKAALTGNLLEAKPLLGDVPRWMLRTAITERDQTVLHMGTGAKKVGFVEEIVKLMEPDDLKLQDRNGNTAFCIAAAVGSLEIAKLMLDKTPNLLTLRGAANVLPLFMAALFGKTEMTKFLYDETKFHLTDQDLADLFFKSIDTDLYGFDKDLLATYEDKEKNTMLHLAAKYPNPPSVSKLPGAALEMQQELLMFEEVKMMMQPSLREKKNVDGLTPQELFTIEHKNLLLSGEKWMKNTASSCMVIATLIATMVFSAAFTVPGGNNDKTGIPIRLIETSFHVFAISDTIALSSSSISILMFLSILTSGYKEMDFQRSLSLKSMVGLWALFISIIAMMITFSSAFFLLYHDKSNSIPILTFMFVSVPIALFVILQYPLLRDILYTTCRSRFYLR